MEQLEDKLGAILENPQMMQQIMHLAQSLSAQEPAQEPQPEAPSAPIPTLDPAMLKALTGIASQTGMDPNQQALLTALHPYLSTRKISKLEKAMRAARLARAASGFLGQGELQTHTGR